VNVFDKLFSSLDIDRLDLVKVDVEGAELPVLRGAEGALQKYTPTLIVELSCATAEAGGYKASDILDFLQELGYTFFKIGRGGRLIEQPNRDFPSLCNICCRHCTR
jgi:hypothetical protein